MPGNTQELLLETEMNMPVQDSIEHATDDGQQTSRAKPQQIPRESIEQPLPTEVNKSISQQQESILDDGEVTTRAAAQKQQEE